MIFRSVVGKLWLTILGFVTLILIVLGLLLTQMFERYANNQESKDLMLISDSVAHVLNNSNDWPSALSYLTQLFENENRKLFVVTKENREVLPSPVKEIIQDERVTKAWQGGKTAYRETYPLLIEGKRTYTELLVIASSYDLKDERVLVIIYESMKVVSATAAGINRIILYAIGVSLLFTTFFALFLTRRITRPLRQIQEAAERIAEGELDQRLSIGFHDEIGKLSRSFNHMATQLDETITELQYEKDRLDRILKSMGDGVISVDIEKEIKIINPLAEEMLFAWQTGRKRLPTKVEEILDKAMRENKETTQILEMNGHYLAVVATPLYERNELNGAVAVIRDVTYEKQMDKLRRDFIANVSHELKTPIAMLQGYSEAILDGVAETEEDRMELVKIIYDESLRMGRLVRELLDLARMEAGHFELNRDDVHLDKLLQKVNRKFQSLAKDKGIQLKFFHLQQNDLVYIDADRMEQVLTNLIDNAFRYTPYGGEILVSANKKEGMLILEVTDTGSGIAEEDIPFLFERFYKGDKARTRGNSGGTGLGLAIVKNIVEAHGGRIFVQSKVGKGTTFIIQIPCEEV
ncbi:Sensor histidine kinase ResE [[Clostridium] ultunense Esp]|uniref:ATP-binding protein n=1 Tax=Thermicanus aegyptius TaxID=94009 RepID=UPI0002B7039A|nr:ATP-binding protein [Thermicanus aegyptius]CCQ94353.1 Sensor histidine kinase ResE [[Clostridium] ultunense Esp]